MQASRRVTLKEHLDPHQGRRDMVSAARGPLGKQEGTPEEAEHNT